MILNKLSSVFLPLFLVLSLPPVHAQQVKVTDVVGRTVTLKQPAKKVLLGEGRDIITLDILDPNPVNLVAAWSGNFKSSLEYEGYKAKFPAIEKLPEVGVSGETFSVEKAIVSNPDVAIFSARGHGPGPSHSEIISQLEAAGIPVMFIDFRQDPFNNTIPSIRILGKVLDREKKAEEFISFYEKRKNKIASTIAQHKPVRPKIFMEMKAGTAENVYSSPGKGNLGDFINLAGAHNIGADVLPGPLGQLNMEFVIQSRADIYIATGLDVFRGRGVVLGSGISKSEATNSIKKRIADPIISEVPAVKNGKVYGLWHLFYASPFNIIALETIAKWSHPDIFKDIDPQSSLDQLNRDFLSIPMRGTYWVEVK